MMDEIHKTKKRRLHLTMDHDDMLGGLCQSTAFGQSTAFMIGGIRPSEDIEADASDSDGADSKNDANHADGDAVSISSSCGENKDIDNDNIDKTLFCEGDKVKVQNGEYCGKMAKVIEVHPSCIIVQIDEDKATRFLSIADVTATTLIETNMISDKESNSSDKVGNEEANNDVSVVMSVHMDSHTIGEKDLKSSNKDGSEEMDTADKSSNEAGSEEDRIGTAINMPVDTYTIDEKDLKSSNKTGSKEDINMIDEEDSKSSNTTSSKKVGTANNKPSNEAVIEEDRSNVDLGINIPVIMKLNNEKELNFSNEKDTEEDINVGGTACLHMDTRMINEKDLKSSNKTGNKKVDTADNKYSNKAAMEDDREDVGQVINTSVDMEVIDLVSLNEANSEEDSNDVGAAMRIDTEKIDEKDLKPSNKAGSEEVDAVDNKPSNKDDIEEDSNNIGPVINMPVDIIIINEKGTKSLNETGSKEVNTIHANRTNIDKDDVIRTGINEREAKLAGMDVIKTKASEIRPCSLSTSRCTQNREDNDNNIKDDSSKKQEQITVYQHKPQKLPSPPHHDIGKHVVIIKGMFIGYQGIIVKGDSEAIGQEHYQDVVSIKLCSRIFHNCSSMEDDDLRSPSSATVTTNPTNLLVILNPTNFQQHQQQWEPQLLVSPPTRFINDKQITRYDEQSQSHSNSLHHQQNRLRKEEDQHSWDNEQDDDSMCYLDRTTSKTVAAATISPGNTEDGELMIENDADISANKSGRQRDNDCDGIVFTKGNQAAVQERDNDQIDMFLSDGAEECLNEGDLDGISTSGGELMIESNHDNISENNSEQPDRQQDDGSDDIVFYKGKQGAVQERDNDRVNIFFFDGTQEWVNNYSLNETFSSKNCRNREEEDNDSGCDVDDLIPDNEWRIPGSGDGGMKFAGQIVRSFRLGEFKEETFIDSFLRTRKLVVIKDFNEEQMKLPIVRIERRDDGHVYELISTKVMDDESGGSLFKMCTPRVLSMVYVQTAGPGIETVNIHSLLSRIADFGSLQPRKMVARLELFQSPAFAMDSTLQLSDFQEIPEEGQIGCGFIGERLLKKLLVRHIKTKKNVSNTVADTTICIQVRIFVPSLGVFKGVLMKKEIPAGSPQIQLPSSMRKIGPSRAKNPIKGAFLVINRAGLDPSDNNKSIGRIPHIDPHSPNSCPKSFQPKVLNDMVLRMFIGLGASNEIAKGYFWRSKKRDGLDHSFGKFVIY